MAKMNEIVAFGKIHKTGSYYMIMPRYGENLCEYFNKTGQRMSRFSVLAIGRAILEAFEKVHSYGYTYNDLKPDNILIGFDQKIGEDLSKNVFKNVSLHLIDFGFAESFLDQDGEHISKYSTDVFRGNTVFASRNQMNFRATSRRDDLQSLVYLMAFFLKDGEFLDFDYSKLQNQTEEHLFKKTKASKLKMTDEEICSGKALCILEFAREVNQIKFSEKPDYDKLRNLLTDIIDIEEVPEETEHNEPRNFITKESNICPNFNYF